jgi:hypothetical protein
VCVTTVVVTSLSRPAAALPDIVLPRSGISREPACPMTRRSDEDVAGSPRHGSTHRLRIQFNSRHNMSTPRTVRQIQQEHVRAAASAPAPQLLKVHVCVCLVICGRRRCRSHCLVFSSVWPLMIVTAWTPLSLCIFLGCRFFPALSFWCGAVPARPQYHV